MIRVGKIINCHGHKGELKLMPLTDDNNRFRHLKEAYLELPAHRYELVHIKSTREHKGHILMTLDEIADMNAAEKLKNIYLCVKKEDAVDLPEDHYFLYQIIGLEVYENGQYLGKITEVLQTGSNDVYVVSHEDRAFYMPALKAVVKEIDLEQGKMAVQLPEGLLD